MEVLSIIWFSAAICGVLALTAALTARHYRRRLLLTAAACWWVAGLLGLASIGLVFLIAAASIVVMTQRHDFVEG